MKQRSEEKGIAELSAVKSETIKAGMTDKDYRIFSQVSCASKVDAKGRLRKGGARLPLYRQ